MSESDFQIALVTPVWNDSERLGRFGPTLAKALKNSGLSIRWIIADDGSEASEKQRLEQLLDSLKRDYEDVEIIFHDRRSRKGGAIRQAWDYCEGCHWLAFVDGDGAVTADSVVEMLRRAMTLEGGACVGVRRGSIENPVRRDFLRGLSFRIFTTLVRRIVGLDLYDTQCGVKVIPAPVYWKIKDLFQEEGFVFDVELLLLLRMYGADIDELPISWHEVSGSKVSLFKDAWGMIAGLVRIRRRARSGAYALSEPVV